MIVSLGRNHAWKLPLVGFAVVGLAFVVMKRARKRRGLKG
jgi:hypothetical protein